MNTQSSSKETKGTRPFFVAATVSPQHIGYRIGGMTMCPKSEP